MGALYDYYRAADEESALAIGTASAGPSGGPADGLAAKGIDPAVCLGRLLAMVLDRPWQVDLVGSRLIWPTGPAPDEYDENSPWAAGPWIEELDEPFRDTLAGVPDSAFAQLADRWHRLEELNGLGPDSALEFIGDLVALARRAQESGDRLYCWMTL